MRMRKKIYLVYQYFGTSESKWSTQWYDFTQEFIKQGYEVTVITSNFIRSDLPEARFFKTVIRDNITIKILPFGDGNNLTIPRRIFNSLFFSFFCFIYLAFTTADKYIFSIGPIGAGLPIILKKRDKTILEVRDLWPDGGFAMKKIPIFLTKPLYLIQKIIYSGSGKIFTCSPAQQSYIETRFPILKGRVSCVEHGIDPRVLNYSQTNRMELSTVQKYWVVVATFGLIHNPMKWLHLAKRLMKIDADIELVLVGSGPLYSKVANTIEEENLFNVKLTGQLSKKGLSDWIRKSEFCLFTRNLLN